MKWFSRKPSWILKGFAQEEFLSPSAGVVGVDLIGEQDVARGQIHMGEPPRVEVQGGRNL